ncbi:MAG: hypothetical protein LBP32_00620 [Spirochaetaceae bacterium]|nr:hypothetical protein [Spirochaetaceae bacterium]
MKRCLLVGFVLLIGTGLFAYEPGDMHINVEGQVGLNIPLIKYTGTFLGPRYRVGGNPVDPNITAVGFDGGVRALFNYHFFNFFSANAGVGIGGFADTYKETFSGGGGSAEAKNKYSAFYVVFPAGVRFNLNTFVFGAGLAAYVPLTSADKGGSGSSSLGDSFTILEDTSFKVKPFLGWYADIGVDMAGGPGKTQGFGMVIRIGSALTGNITKTTGSYIKRFTYFPIALVFNYNFKVANVPVRGGR